jgi:hypothetical protein
MADTTARLPRRLRTQGCQRLSGAGEHTLYRVVDPPEEVDPVDPLVPLLLLEPEEPPVDGVVVVELPEAPMPDEAPEREVPPLGEVVAVDESDGDTEPLAVPPVEPMPEAVPDALPEAVEPQAASAAAQITGIRILIMWNSCLG